MFPWHQARGEQQGGRSLWLSKFLFFNVNEDEITLNVGVIQYRGKNLKCNTNYHKGFKRCIDLADTIFPDNLRILLLPENKAS